MTDPKQPAAGELLADAPIEAAGDVLFRAGNFHSWWRQPGRKTIAEMGAADPIAKSEFLGIVEEMLRAAIAAAEGANNGAS